MMERFGGLPASLQEKAEALRTQGKTAMFAAIDGRAAAVIVVADPIKETAPEAVKALQAQGVRIVMLSGDSRKTAEAVGRRLGIDEVIGEVLPEQKVEKIKTSSRKATSTDKTIYPPQAALRRTNWPFSLSPVLV